MAPRTIPLLVCRALLVASSFQTAFTAPTGTPTTAEDHSPLLGYNPANPVVHQATPFQYTLVPGQSDDAKIGAYLNFENVENPQPIRGSKGGTDPGPREY